MCARRIAIAIVLAIGIFGSSSVPAAERLSGSASVIDGDTITLGPQRVRLEGIDAPETDQVCLDANGKPWTCGISSRDFLFSHLAGRVVSCEARGEDRYGRTLAICSVGGE